MRKRGQIIGMPLVYIAVAIMMALIIYFGFNSLSKINSAKDVTQVSKFVLEFEDQVEVVYNYDVGSQKRFESRFLPNKIKYVCFYNPQKSLSLNLAQINSMDEEFNTYLELSDRDNLFLLPIALYEIPYPDYFIPNLKIKDSSPNPFCAFNTQQGVNLILENYLENGKIYVGVSNE